MKIAIAAIVRNELEYLTEWIAWHRIAGFTDFYFSDNDSDDGTRELLDLLHARGVVRVRHEPRGGHAQVKAYNTMLKAWGREADRIAFLDADEFLVSLDQRRPVDMLEDLMLDPSAGAVGIHWRLFGSGGHVERTPELVIERFTRCAPDNHPKCTHIKTYARPEAIELQRIHRANLRPGYRYLDASGARMRFASAPQNPGGDDGERSMDTGPSALRVHHYAVKSQKEYAEKKQHRGDAMVGAAGTRNANYFSTHDLNDLECSAARRHAEATRRVVEEIEGLLR